MCSHNPARATSLCRHQQSNRLCSNFPARPFRQDEVRPGLLKPEMLVPFLMFSSSNVMKSDWHGNSWPSRLRPTSSKFKSRRSAAMRRTCNNSEVLWNPRSSVLRGTRELIVAAPRTKRPIRATKFALHSCSRKAVPERNLEM